MKEKNVLNMDCPIERYFEELSRIPRNSCSEKGISDYIVKFARDRNLDVYRDEIWNVIVKKPASAGSKHRAPVILEAHMDMVCAKTAESSHDFTKDPIELHLEDGILRAEDTTLGADDGFGIAYMLAILDDDQLSHPPLECVFTVQEETNMLGAKMVDKSRLTARRMIGLDGDYERRTSVGSASSDRILLHKTYEAEEKKGLTVTITLHDFFTGTYGGITHPQCGNTIKIAARLLKRLSDGGLAYQLLEWHSGTAENFNPFEGTITVYIDEKEKVRLEQLVYGEFEAILGEFEDPRFYGKLNLAYAASDKPALNTNDSRQLVSVLHLMPNNLFHAAIENGEMRAISNFGTIELYNGKLQAVMSCRSKYASSELQLVSCCRDMALLGGFDVEAEPRYRPWPYDKNSQMRALANQIMEKAYGYTLEEEICPGGLEAACFFEGKEDFDAVCLGVDLKNLHTPDESMDMASFHRMYHLVCKMLETMD